MTLFCMFCSCKHWLKIVFDQKQNTKLFLRMSNWNSFIHSLFGFGTWLNLNGIWIQLPLLVPSLPEGWSLSSQLGLASNFANVGPLIILLIKLLFGKSQSYEVPSICVIFLVGIIFPSVLSFTWSNQVIIFGQARSMYLLVIGFFLALVNCTSSVTYLPFVNRFDKKWLNIYFAGESLSSLVPAMLGLAQVRFLESMSIFCFTREMLLFLL